MKQEEKYRLMIYFAHSTMVMYSKTIIDCKNIKEFKEKNKDIIQRVCDEAISIMNYELSSNQINTAIAVYINSKNNPQSVYETKIYTLK